MDPAPPPELQHELAALRADNQRLRADLATLRPQLQKAWRQRHEIHDHLRSARKRIAELEKLLPG